MAVELVVFREMITDSVYLFFLFTSSSKLSAEQLKSIKVLKITVEPFEAKVAPRLEDGTFSKSSRWGWTYFQGWISDTELISISL